MAKNIIKKEEGNEKEDIALDIKNKLIWCFNQKEGIKFIEPNDNLSNSYIKESNETFDSMLLNKGKWKIIMGYYGCYNALYSILIKAGIKCEIHSCTIALMNLLGFNGADIKFMESLKDDRISVQYYLKDKHLGDENKVKDFLLKCKEIKDSVDVKGLRDKIHQIKNGKS